jgi:hypothetical protein
MRLIHGAAVVVALAFAVGPLALEAFARGGGVGGGGRGGGVGGGRGGTGGGRMGGGRMGGGRMGGAGGFGMGRGGPGQSGNSAKEWEVLQNMEERKKMVKERRQRLIDQDRKAEQEAMLAAARLQSVISVTTDDVR